MRLCRAAAVAWLALPGAAQAALAIDVGEVHLAAFSARGVRIEVGLPFGAGPPGVRIRARSVAAGDRLLARGVTVACPSLVLDGEALRCRQGTLSGALTGLGAITGDWSGSAGMAAGRVRLQLRGAGAAQVRVDAARDGWQLRAEAGGLPLASLQTFVAALAGPLPGALTIGAGEGALTVAAAGRGQRLGRLDVSITLGGVDVEGASAAQGLDARARLQLRRSDGWRVALSAAATGGLAYVELPPLRANAPAPGLTLDATDAPLTLTLKARQGPRGGWSIEALKLRQPTVMSVEGHGAVRRDRGGWRVAAVGGGVAVDDLTRAWPAWVQPWLLGTAFDELEVSGSFGATVDWRGGRLRAARLLPRGLSARDRMGRFAVSGLDGSLAFAGGDDEVASSIRWQGLSFYRLPFGTGRIALASRAGRAWMTAWEGVPVFDGRLVVERLQARSGAGAPRLELDGTLTPVSLAEVSRALGGPPLAGTVAASLAGLTLEPGRLAVGGALEVAAFGGRITVSGLRLDDPFGLVPVLHADVEVRGLDLEQLTAELAFGKISGHLDGYIRELELQAWQPVYFEAALATPPDDDAPHRISQRAVTNLGRLGGGGTAVLSQGLLRLFSEYSYDQLGFSCRLFNGMLELDGVAPADDGSWLLTPGGLLPPWIGIRAVGHAVPWTTLTDTLRAIRTGEVDVR